jgi:hypothetical protein
MLSENFFFYDLLFLQKFLSKKKSSRQIWDANNTILFGPVADGSCKEISNERFNQRMIYLETCLQSLIDEITRMPLQVQI